MLPAEAAALAGVKCFSQCERCRLTWMKRSKQKHLTSVNNSWESSTFTQISRVPYKRDQTGKANLIKSWNLQGDCPAFPPLFTWLQCQRVWQQRVKNVRTGRIDRHISPKKWLWVPFVLANVLGYCRNLGSLRYGTSTASW